MTSPKQARDTDYGRYYTHPVTGEQLVSITNVLDSISKPALVPAAVKITAETAANMLPQLVASVLVPQCKPKRVADECGNCTPCLVKTIKRQHKVVWEHARDTGTLVHDHAEAHLTGRQIVLDPEVEPFMKSYLQFLADFDIDISKHIEAAELTVAHPPLGLAGTLDVMAWLRLDGYVPGHAVTQLPGDKRALWIYDIKTSLTKAADVLYREQPLQLAAQRHCKEAWLPDGSVVPMPRGVVGAAILNLRADGYEFIPVPSGEPEWKAYQGLLTGTHWLHQDLTKGLRPVHPSGRAKAAAKTTTRKAA
jgi:hypothetical protein